MSGRVTFEKEINCRSSDFGCEGPWNVARRKMQKQFDALVCDPKHPAGSESPDSYTVVCSGRPNVKRREMLKLDATFRELTSKLLMTAITSIVNGALNLIGAK